MPGVVRSVLSLGTLRETRAILRSTRAWVLIVPLAGAYLFISMLIGGMLTLAPTNLPFFWEVLTPGPGALSWWNYPALVVVGQWGVLDLPFLPTITMAIVSTAVGIATAATLVLVFGNSRAFQWLFARRRGTMSMGVGPAAAAGAAPAITGIATLGACCCTSCASVAGISVVAATSGSSLTQLLENSWYLSVFQLVVVGAALIIQERAIRLARTACPVPPPRDRRYYASSLIRLGLLIAGVTWSLAMLVEWITLPPSEAPPAIWYHWTFEHQLLAGLAIGAAMLPREFVDVVIARSRTITIRTLRGLALLAGITWGIWVPPYLTDLGLGGFLNELLGYLGYPASVGAIPPDSPLGAALYFHWSMQHLLLASFAIAFAVSPIRVGSMLLWSVEARGVPSPAPTEGAAPPAAISLPPAVPGPFPVANAASGTAKAMGGHPSAPVVGRHRPAARSAT
ncbi:MAG: hypothetical protein L3K19_02745 [Thermoplasmata archaeon]|nr:hypothetical protein [Thermoplasmata archaeon]